MSVFEITYSVEKKIYVDIPDQSIDYYADLYLEDSLGKGVWNEYTGDVHLSRISKLDYVPQAEVAVFDENLELIKVIEEK